MVKNKENSAKIADPAIEKVFEEFLSEQRKTLKDPTYRKYEAVIDLLTSHLDGYAYESLSKKESALFDKYFNAKGDEHKEFCQLFGPKKIPGNIFSFLSYFMVSKVICGVELKQAAATVTKKLLKWLVSKGYKGTELTVGEWERIDELGSGIVKGERASNIINDYLNKMSPFPYSLPGKNSMGFARFTIKKLKPRQIWLEECIFGRGEDIGPIQLPERATELLQQGWDISCELARVGGKWKIVQMGNVYP